MKRLAFLSVALPLAARILLAQSLPQSQVNVGDPVVQSAKLKPYRNSWKLTLQNSNGAALGETAIWNDQLRPVQKDGQRCLERIQKAIFSKDGKVVGSTETVNIFTRDTMTPVFRKFSTNTAISAQQQETLVEFEGATTLHVQQTRSGSKSNETVVLEKPAFDFNGGVYGLIFAAMDLREGLSGSIPSVAESDFSSSPEWIRFSVGKAERVSAGNESIETLPVNVESKAGFMKFWISRQLPYIIQLDFQDTQHGNLLWKYRMIESRT